MSIIFQPRDRNARKPAAIAALQLGDGDRESSDGRGCVEYARPAARGAWLHRKQPLAQPRRVSRSLAAIIAFLTRKWQRELDYRLIKELWAFRDNRIAVRFAYEWHDDSGNWTRSYGNENWEFDEHGLMHLRLASINDLPIRESERRYRWPLGRRPDGHPSLSDLGF